LRFQRDILSDELALPVAPGTHAGSAQTRGRTHCLAGNVGALIYCMRLATMLHCYLLGREMAQHEFEALALLFSQTTERIIARYG